MLCAFRFPIIRGAVAHEPQISPLFASKVSVAHLLRCDVCHLYSNQGEPALITGGNSLPDIIRTWSLFSQSKRLNSVIIR